MIYVEIPNDDVSWIRLNVELPSVRAADALANRALAPSRFYRVVRETKGSTVTIKTGYTREA